MLKLPQPRRMTRPKLRRPGWPASPRSPTGTPLTPQPASPRGCPCLLHRRHRHLFVDSRNRLMSDVEAQALNPAIAAAAQHLAQCEIQAQAATEQHRAAEGEVAVVNE